MAAQRGEAGVERRRATFEDLVGLRMQLGERRGRSLQLLARLREVEAAAGGRFRTSTGLRQADDNDPREGRSSEEQQGPAHRLQGGIPGVASAASASIGGASWAADPRGRSRSDTPLDLEPAMFHLNLRTCPRFSLPESSAFLG
jgi:hypothetical protein